MVVRFIWMDKMVDWLNLHIGADAATYIGTFLGFIALLWGGSKLVKKNHQVQKGGDNSTNIQVGGSVNLGNKKNAK